MSNEVAANDDEVARTNLPTGMSVGELIKHLSKYPPATEVYIESTDEVDTLSGGIYFPDLNCVSLIGHEAEIEMDDAEFKMARCFGEVELVGPEEDEEEEEEEEDDDAIASCVIEGAIIPPVEAPSRFKESDAPPRPAKHE